MRDAVSKLHSSPAGRNAFAQLLADDSLIVASWVAAALLADGNVDAVPVLEKTAEQPGMLGFSAQMILREYRAGRLKGPFGAAV